MWLKISEKWTFSNTFLLLLGQCPSCDHNKNIHVKCHIWCSLLWCLLVLLTCVQVSSRDCDDISTNSCILPNLIRIGTRIEHWSIIIRVYYIDVYCDCWRTCCIVCTYNQNVLFMLKKIWCRLIYLELFVFSSDAYHIKLVCAENLSAAVMQLL